MRGDTGNFIRNLTRNSARTSSAGAKSRWMKRQIDETPRRSNFHSIGGRGPLSFAERNFVDGVKRLTMEQFFPVTRPQRSQIKLVHKSLIQLVEDDFRGKSVCSQGNRFDCRFGLVD